MSAGPEPTRQIGDVPATTPFVAPEELARRAGFDELLRLGANESAFGPSPQALAAMNAALAHVSWYGDPESAELRAALAERLGCTPANITVASGIDDILGLTVRAYLGHGERALAADGTYPTFGFHVTGYGAHLETVPYARDGTIPLDALAERAHAIRPRIVYLANPDNPSGSFHGRSAIERFVRELPNDVLLLLDEAYADFVPAGELMRPTVVDRVIRTRTFSKAYGMAGARIAYALAAPAVIATFQKIRHHYGVNRTAQAGALAALGDPGFVASVVAEVARGREDYARLAGRLGLRTRPSFTNFVLFDLGARERAEALVAELLRRGVFIRKPGRPPLDQFVRVTVGSEAERARFAEVLPQALAALKLAPDDGQRTVEKIPR